MSENCEDNLHVSKVYNGDPNAFRYFIRKYKDLAFSVSVSIVKSEVIAEEVVQDAFLKAYRNIRKFNGSSKFSTWFYRIVVNVSLDAQKRQKKELLIYEENYDTEIPDDTFVLSLEAEERKLMITEALQRLPPNESLALRLFYLQEENLKDLAASTGWSESNAKVILHRARKSLFAVLKRFLKTKVN
ncbi:RNA polymerase sigma factor [Desertivirga arenae]|uniref:RNA polymerase sigma factor n=1 Tax=Desertivirga arenae TaxID=2810309 RepID=UPI001A96644C|nr:sigma-70 family RNA polymerase sigma factor [Pedobacter sp. SYSU D00823]